MILLMLHLMPVRGQFDARLRSGDSGIIVKLREQMNTNQWISDVLKEVLVNSILV